MKRRFSKFEKSALEITDESIHLLRQAPPQILASYYIGSIPFILGFLYFWSDMSRSAFAYERCCSASLGMALLFLWMKIWQAVFASQLRAFISHSTGEWSWRRILRLAAVQGVIQPWGLFLIPLAALVMVPFYSVYAFFQNVTAFGDGESDDTRAVAHRAWRQALVWPRQNHMLLWLLCPWTLAIGLLAAFGGAWLMMTMSPQIYELNGLIWFGFAMAFLLFFVLPVAPFGCIVAGNIATVIILAPEVLNMLFGIDTVFTLSGWHGVLNTTFLVTVYGLSYLCLDPLCKAAFILRCFYGESLKTGEDLRVELRELEHAPHAH